ncbi:hypothetical protein AC1031_010183 [Aphanomyces cochlioides]|nr:hypothetical protein AC1031_010183 [Aphanomyces cochlioides]
MASKTPRGRGKGWCSASVEFLLDQVERYLPIGRNGWEKDEHAFNLSDFVQRDLDALKRKFVVLKNNPKPTGDPDCPPEVVRAKRINREIDSRASVLTFEDDQESHHSEDEFDDEETVDTVAPSIEKPNRTGMGRSELSELGSALKRKQPTVDAGGMSYVAKKRLSLDKFIDKVTSNDDMMSSDMMSMMLMMDQRAAEREVPRAERDMQWKQEQLQFQMAMEERRIERESRREETQLMMIMANLFKEK